MSRHDIIAVALRVLDTHGVERFTMRKLATELGVSPSALYWHFPNKESLFAAVMDDVTGELQWDKPTGGTPRERLAAHLLVLRAHWRRHPALVRLGRTVRPSTSGAFSADGMTVLREMGFDEAEARTTWRALVWLVLGFFFVEEGVAGSAHHQPVDDIPGRFRVSLGEASELVDTEALFAHLLDLTLDGLELGSVRRPTPSRPTAER